MNTINKFKTIIWLGAVIFLINACSGTSESVEFPHNNFTEEDYTKQEVYIEMRDSVKLFTAIYTPKDTTQDYPVLIKRTPYSCYPYGADSIPEHLSHNPDLVASGYIFVFQDVRGRWNSEGVFENVKPPYSLWDDNATDEITDSYDTFDWLVNNLDHFNGNIGQYGNSYPGWTTLIGARTNHPNLKAVMAMAPVTNFYFEDFSRYGLCAMNYIPVLNAFGTYKDKPTTESWYDMKDSIFYTDVENKVGRPYYEFFRDRLALTNFDDILADNVFWERIKSHPNYDEYQEKRNWLNYINEEMKAQIMIVGGWNDEQNLYGILNSYKIIKEKNPETQFVIGPWSHGHNKRRDSLYYLGNVCYGEGISEEFQKTVEYNYFEYHLKGIGSPPDFNVKAFDTGEKEWNEFEKFPVEPDERKTLYLGVSGQLTADKEHQEGWRTYISDPKNPVPYLEKNDFQRMAPKSYFTADQRFLQGRKDVLSYTTEILDKDLTVFGEIEAYINFATNLDDADIYVKVIDVYPDNRTTEETDVEGINYQGYQQLVRAGYIRGRYRESFVKGIPFKRNEKTEVKVPLLEVFHTFKKGHRIMVQIQSSMFPLFDMNPQQWVDDIYKATKSDFKSAEHRIYNDSRIVFPSQK
ncbi:MAG: CocE/NonD family hydrolase [Crocinitomicaceae bacterium]|nr:CocE/NonD family hydrolase [Crocinitomicaceae bacterium]